MRGRGLGLCLERARRRGERPVVEGGAFANFLGEIACNRGSSAIITLPTKIVNPMKTARKAGKKKPSRPRTLSLDRRLELLVERGEAAARQSEADLKLLLERDKAAARQSEADLKLLVERGKIAARQAEADRDRLARLEKKADADRKLLLERGEKAARQSEADRDRLARLEKKADAERKLLLERDEKAARQSEADRDRLARLEKKADAERKLLLERDEMATRRVEADRDRLARLENTVDDDRKKNEGHRRNLSRAMENAFAASLPRVMKKAHNIVVKPKDIRMRARKNNRSREFDFIAPNGKLVLAGEVKTRLTSDDVVKFSEALALDFRKLFPEYEGAPVYGVVAGGVIDEDAAHHARKRGFFILRLEGAEVHPATDKGFRPIAY